MGQVFSKKRISTGQVQDKLHTDSAKVLEKGQNRTIQIRKRPVRAQQGHNKILSLIPENLQISISALAKHE